MVLLGLGRNRLHCFLYINTESKHGEVYPDLRTRTEPKCSAGPTWLWWTESRTGQPILNANQVQNFLWIAEFTFPGSGSGKIGSGRVGSGQSFL